MKKKLKVEKTIEDMRGYLAEYARMAKDLDDEQTEQLNEILRSLLVLLVALRKSSHLGEIQIDWNKL